MIACRTCDFVLLAVILSGCGTSVDNSHPEAGVSPPVGDAKLQDAGPEGDAHDANARDAAADVPSPHIDAPVSDASDSSTVNGGCARGCPTGYQCQTANGLPVCRAPSGVPLFSHIFVIMEENTSLSTLLASVTSNAAPNFEALRAKYASGTEYHGVAHPSLPNYIALTSGGTQGIGCDCKAQSGQGSCDFLTCNLVLGECSCSQSAANLADQLETAGRTWMAFGEGMGTPCNVVDDSSTNYAVRHVPFLYYDDIQSNAARCNAHVVDYESFDPASAPEFTYIAPNLIDDMHDPIPAGQANITNGDTWIGPTIAKLTASSAYTDGGLIVVVWDEDDGSGGITGTNDAIPIFILSPYAKSGGYMSVAMMDHYSLLATFEDGMGLPRLGNAGVARSGVADTLADYFPDP